MRKVVSLFLIMVIFFSFASDSYTFVIALSNPLVRSVVMKYASNTTKNYVIPVALGSGLAYLTYKGTQLVYDNYINANNVDNANDNQIVNTVEYNGYKWIFYRRNSYTGCTNVTVPTVFIHPTEGLVIRRNVRRGNCDQNSYTFDYNDFYRRAELLTPSGVSYTTVALQDNIESNSVVLPFSLDLTKSLNENAEIIKNTLRNNSNTIDALSTVTPSNVADILAHLPPALTNQMPNSIVETHMINEKAIQQVKELDNLDNALPALPVQVEIKDVDIPSISDVTLPEIPVFNYTLELPEVKDFLLPVKNFFTNFLRSVPFVSLLQSARINTTDAYSKISFTVFNRTVEYDFNNFNSVFSFMASVLVFVASVFAIIIIIL